MHLVKKAGYSKKTVRTGAVTLIQRFGRSGAPVALNLNIHFHMLFLDGVYVDHHGGTRSSIEGYSHGKSSPSWAESSVKPIYLSSR
jgi:hypothetical protein